jgi:hypothetical protein
MNSARALSLLLGAWDRQVPTARDDALAEIEPGAAAAWARADRELADASLVAGAPCRMVDGRAGRVIEVLDGTHVTLACEVA